MQAKGRIHWLAVLAGTLLDNVLTLLIGGIAIGITPDIGQGSYFTSTAGAVTWVLLVLCTVAGGWLAGRIAKHERFLHGFMVGGFGIVLLLLDSWLGGQVTLDQLALVFVAAVFAGLAGYSSRWMPARERK